MRAILGFLRRRARDAGIADGRSGAVTIVQRFGGALNTNIHFHALVLDGVFAQEGDVLRFHRGPALDATAVDEVLATVEAYLRRLLGGADEDAGDPVDAWADEAPVLAGLAAASVQGRAALGARAGTRVRRLGDWRAATPTSPELGPCHARHAGFDLHAGICVHADQRDQLERVTRYALRPPVPQERFTWTADGQVRVELRRPWSDGTTHLVFDPPELLERLAALVPRPRVNLTLYHGVLAPRAAWRARVVEYGRAEDSTPESDAQVADTTAGAIRPGRWNYRWAELMRRTLGLDVLDCPRCSGRLRLIAVIDDPAVTQRILRHLGLPTGIPETRPARSPPLPLVASPTSLHVVYDYDEPA